MRVVIPERYKTVRADLSYDSVSIGGASVELFAVGEIEGAQVGYSVGIDGQELEWPANMLVIGREGLMGDPIMIDTSIAEYPVFTAMHGEGDWDPQQIATGLKHFVLILERLQDLARGRATPVELEKNPVPEEEIDEFLEFVEIAGDDIDTSFWESMFEV